MRRIRMAAFACAAVMVWSQTCMCGSLSDWYQGKAGQEIGMPEEGAGEELGAAGGFGSGEGPGMAEGTGTVQGNGSAPEAGGYETPQVSLKLEERKIVSPALSNAVVGRMMVPVGWDVRVTDLMLGSESIICPNALWVTVTDPEGACELSFLSRREFEQTYTDAMGFVTASQDDVYDYSSLMHTLDYREADGVCDLMTSVLYGSGFSCVGEKALTEEEEQSLEQARELYDEAIRSQVAQSGIEQFGESLVWVDASAAQRTYSDGYDTVTVSAASSGYRLDFATSMSESQTIFWAIPSVFAMKTSAQDHDAYQEVFDLFCLSAAVSREFEDFRNQNSQKLVQEFINAQNSGTVYTPSGGTADNVELEEGDTYSAFEAWDDYIRDETDYTTGDGTHVKIPSSYDHVFEGDDGTIYAGSSPDGPYGSIELNPTQVGE